MQDIPELILIDKPIGITSFKVLGKLKERFGDLPAATEAAQGGRKLKMGHAGTLDPMASGLMVVGVGQGTKKLCEYVGLPKEYDAEILIGEQRTTSDMEGEVVVEADVPELPAALLSETLAGLVGVLRLPVSAFSAMKRGGQPLYKKAHQGQEVGVLPMRDMQVNSVEYVSHQCTNGKCVVKVIFNVESGVYIRSLAEELGKRLGYPAVLKSLRRTKVGDFSVDDRGVIKIGP